jgi:RND family efflux transporter MFP subunit
MNMHIVIQREGTMRTRKPVFAALTLAGAVFCAGCGSGGAASPGAAPQTGGNQAESSTAAPPLVAVTKVVSQKLAITVHLPAELRPYQEVALYPKVSGFVKWIGVDRGSRVKKGERIIELEAPELAAQRAEAQSRLQSANAQLSAARAKLAGSESTFQKLKEASKTPGAISGNDMTLTEKAVEADRATVKALEENANAARQSAQSTAEVEGYSHIPAPFDGVITERRVHPGALVSSSGAAGVAMPMVRLETLARLRLVVAVPEAYAGSVAEGRKVSFTVPTFPGEMFAGVVSRVAHAVEAKTRTMPVELDVANPSGRLNPGSFCDVVWPVERREATLQVPASAVGTTVERVFVVRVREGKVEWVDVKTGITSGKLVEVFGDLHEGDMVAMRGTDELRAGMSVRQKLTDR